MNPNSRSPWAAWLRFMKSMSISAQGRSRLNWVCRWRTGLRQRLQPGDPHPGRREGVHPEDHPDAGLGGVGLEQGPGDLSDDGDHRPGHHPDRDRRGALERGRDHAGVRRDLAQGRLAVQLLAAGDEPDLELAQWLHIDAPESEPARSTLDRPRHEPAHVLALEHQEQDAGRAPPSRRRRLRAHRSRSRPSSAGAGS